MLDLGFYEKVIQPPTKKKSTASKIIATVIYIALVVFFILTIIISGMFVPGFIAIVILSLALYLFFGVASYEYEYSFSEAGVTLAKIFAKKRRSTVFDISDEQILLIAPANEQNLAKEKELAVSRSYDIYADEEEGDIWMIIFEAEKGVRASFRFRAEDYAIKVLKSLRPSAMRYR